MLQSRRLQAEKLASLGQRASSVVHELAKPLTTILGNAQRLVFRDPVAGSTPELLRILEEAERASAFIAELTVVEGFVESAAPSTVPVSELTQLPIQAEPLMGIRRKVPSENAPHVLVVEDEPTVVALIADVLGDKGLRVDLLLDR